MGFNITFGTMKTTRTGSFQKYADKAVATIEEEKAAGKSRRILFNEEAMNTLNLEVGESQDLLFGFVESDESGDRRLIVANVTGDPQMKGEVTYSTSKNKIAFRDSKEKGKGIASKVLTQEINSFLEVEVSMEHEYELVSFAPEGMPNTGLDLFEFAKIRTEKDSQTINDEIYPEVAPIENEVFEDVVEETDSMSKEKVEVEPVTIGNPHLQEEYFEGDSKEEEF